MSVEYSFTPSNPISTTNRTNESFELTDTNDNNYTSSFFITDSDFYNSIVNFLGDNYEVRTNINIKNYDIICDKNFGQYCFNYNPEQSSKKIQSDFIIPVAFYSKLLNYYFVLTYGNDLGSPAERYLYLCIIYPESQKCRTTMFRENSGQKAIVLYNINKNVFVLADNLAVLENRNDVIFYENYEFENTHYDSSDFRNLNGLSITISNTPETMKTTVTNHLGLCPIYDNNSNKVFKGIYRALLNNYNNEIVRADGISYFILPMRINLEGSYLNLTISSEIIGAE